MITGASMRDAVEYIMPIASQALDEFQSRAVVGLWASAAFLVAFVVGGVLFVRWALRMRGRAPDIGYEMDKADWGMVAAFGGLVATVGGLISTAVLVSNAMDIASPTVGLLGYLTR